MPVCLIVWHFFFFISIYVGIYLYCVFLVSMIYFSCVRFAESLKFVRLNLFMDVLMCFMLKNHCQPPEGWDGGVGFVSKEMIQTHCPAPAPDIQVNTENLSLSLSTLL